LTPTLSPSDGERENLAHPVPLPLRGGEGVRRSGEGNSDGSHPAIVGRPAAEGTELNRALDSALPPQRNLKTMLCLSDGAWKLGKCPLAAATRYREQNIPICAVAVGREKPLPDVAIESVSAPAYGLLGEQIIIPFRIRSALPREVKTTISLVDPEGE